MKLLKTKKGIAFLAVLVVAAVAAFGAYAYFTAPGSGSGTAAVGSSSNIQLSGNPVGTFYPGGADLPVTVSITNPGGGKQLVGTISGSVASNGGCLGGWFVVDPVAYNTEVNPGATTSVSTAARLTDTGANQDVCQGKTMTINWSSN